ncbi:MAG: sulfatase-like hydrolase/transferase [Rikenellaceae bacterium]
MKPNKTLLLSSMALMSLGIANAEKKPNILFIIVDDQDAATLDVYGDTECDTPNIDALAKQGMAFTGAYQMGSYTAAVSTASRTMIMTGMSVAQAEHTKEANRKAYKKPSYKKPFGNMDVVTPDKQEYNSLPAVFSRGGYETFRTCKNGNSYYAANFLFDERYDLTCRMGNDTKGSKWHADHVVKYFETRKAKDEADKKPFLVYLGFSHPHDARNGKPELLEKYGAENVPVPTKLNDKLPKLPINWLPKKTFLHGDDDVRDEMKVPGVMDRRDEVTVRNEKGKEFACIENIDIQIGRVMEALAATGELENTYIFFTSDHGIAVGRHSFMGKQNLYEHTFRVPFLVVGPDVAKNKKVVGNIYLSDVMPSLCDIAGIEYPDNLFGKSFKPVIEGKAKTMRDVMFGVYYGGSKPGIRCVKQGDWKLLKYDAYDGTVHETQLFNLKENPYELTIEHHAPEVIAKTGNTPKKNQVNLASDPKYKKKLAEMEALLLEQMIATDDPYRLWDQPKK